jgi:hypothetical protein
VSDSAWAAPGQVPARAKYRAKRRYPTGRRVFLRSGWRGLRKLAIAGALLIGASTHAGAAAGAPPGGTWLLGIDGHNSYSYGDPGFSGGIRVPWSVEIRFVIADGQYRAGSGTARWSEHIESFSQPEGWFECRLVDSTYLDRGLTLHHTPHLRTKAFPVAGEVDGELVRLQPGYGAPGNYLALAYECSTDQVTAPQWFGRAERGRQVFGKRQDAERVGGDERPRVKVREVMGVPPESRLEVPLRDGWRFSVGGPDDAQSARYRLRRLD